MSGEPTKRVVGWHDAQGIYVYQAFKPSIVQHAAAKGTFGAGFTFDRLTWIKPSFGWMLHRSDYATKHRQEAIARIHLSHEGFLEILRQGIPTLYDPVLFADEHEWSRTLEKSDVRYQWDPDRALPGFKLERRAIQLGLRGETVQHYVHEWILRIEDVTELAHAIGAAVKRRDKTPPAVPEETEYPLPPELQRTLGYDDRSF